MVLCRIRSGLMAVSLPRASGGGPCRCRRRRIRARSSPRERGWSPFADPGHADVLGLPRASGGGPWSRGTRRFRRGLPRASGGGPWSCGMPAASSSSSPRERGWSRTPASAGSGWGLPRASGGGPGTRGAQTVRTPSSPRERGWSAARVRRQAGPAVFPARAGVVRRGGDPAHRVQRLPRASGGGPIPRRFSPVPSPSSPRERGWSHRHLTVDHPHRVFPARAGVVPACRPRRASTTGLPRASGGGPAASLRRWAKRASSPRERGWSAHAGGAEGPHDVFPARAGVVRAGGPVGEDRGGLPRASGGGPSRERLSVSTAMSSPRERGWSVLFDPVDPPSGVFPARAGVVRPCSSRSPRSARLPARAGVVRRDADLLALGRRLPRANRSSPKYGRHGRARTAYCGPEIA